MIYCFALLDNWLSAIFKYSIWKWKIVGILNLNMSFTAFDLKYSGEACLQEKIIVNVTQDTTIGRYCGRRYNFSIFASPAPITLEFHTFEQSTSQFILHYQITNSIMKTLLCKFKNYNIFNVIENVAFVYPFSWNHIYIIENVPYFSWNIIVPKMYRLLMKILIVSRLKKTLIIYDGPGLNSKQLETSNEQFFTASSFQVLVVYLNHVNKEIEIIFKNILKKDKVENYHNILKVKEEIKLYKKNLSCEHLTHVLSALKFSVPINHFVNITLLSLKYHEPNVGYCKYGGLSIYDYVNNLKKEVLLLCDNISQIIASSTQHLFLIFYAYLPYSEIRPTVIVKPSICKGVHILRYGLICLVMCLGYVAIRKHTRNN